jgi:hypothetical protein
MADRFSLHALFADFCSAVAAPYQLQRAGIVRSSLLEGEFVLVAHWSADEPSPPVRNRRFDRAGTVGEWVLRNRRCFIGSCREDVQRFPATLQDFLDEGIQSNFVDFVDADQLILFFALSRAEEAFSNPAELRQKLAALPHCISLAEHWDSPGASEVMQTELKALLHDMWKRLGTVPIQRQFEHAYFESLLAITSGRVDGPQGAARLAGVKPSTFRSRVSRVNLE